MYTAFYGLNTDPFCLSPDPKFRFMHPSYQKAKVYMQYALQRAEGFISITGAPGTGKSTLVKELVSDLRNTNINVATLTNTQLGADDLLRLTSYTFGIDQSGADKATVILRLERFLKEQYRRGRRNLLIVDEAQDLPQKSLEQLRLLTNLEQDNYPLLQIFLVGQPQLLNVLRLDVMEQLLQRIIAACALQPLTPQEIEPYVLHRLRIAGWKQDPVIEPGAYTFLYHFSGGLPRKLNQLCSRLLLFGFVENKHQLTAGDASLVIDELRREQLSFSPLEHTANTVKSPIHHLASVVNSNN
jgi:general secretion pathway protein A